MSIEELKSNLPDSAKDIKLNLSSIMTEEGAKELTVKQIYMIALSSAYSIKNRRIVSSVLEEANEYLSPVEISATQSAAVIMSMNNIYYRFVHLVGDKSFAAMPAGLRMNAIAHSGINKVDFELCCLAVSAINGCGMCMDSHTAALTKAGVSKVSIQSAIRIAAVFNAAALGITIAA